MGQVSFMKTTTTTTTTSTTTSTVLLEIGILKRPTVSRASYPLFGIFRPNSFVAASVPPPPPTPRMYHACHLLKKKAWILYERAERKEAKVVAVMKGDRQKSPLNVRLAHVGCLVGESLVRPGASYVCLPLCLLLRQRRPNHLQLI